MLTAAEMEVLRAAQQQGVPDVEEPQQRLLEGDARGWMEVLRASPELRGAAPPECRAHRASAMVRSSRRRRWRLDRRPAPRRDGRGELAGRSTAPATRRATPSCAPTGGRTADARAIARRDADDYTTMASRVIETAISRVGRRRREVSLVRCGATDRRAIFKHNRRSGGPGAHFVCLRCLKLEGWTTLTLSRLRRCALLKQPRSLLRRRRRARRWRRGGRRRRRRPRRRGA